MRAGQFRAMAPHLVFHPVSAFFYLVAGITVAVVGALLPALDAAREPPARALKAGDEQRMFQRMGRAWPGLAFIAAGAALSQLGPVKGLPLFGYAAIACFLVGAIALMPCLSRWVFHHIPFTSKVPLALAVALAAQLCGTALVIDDDAAALDFAELLHRAVDMFARMDLDAGREIALGQIGGIVAQHRRTV